MVPFKKINKISLLNKIKMIAFRKIAIIWTTRLLVMDCCLEIVYLLSQIRRSFNGMSRDKMFDVDSEMIKRHRSGG